MSTNQDPTKKNTKNKKLGEKKSVVWNANEQGELLIRCTLIEIRTARPISEKVKMLHTSRPWIKVVLTSKASL